VNRSLIIQAAWNVATEKNPMLTTVLKAKYYPNSSFWKVTNNTTKYVFWSTILPVKQEVIPQFGQVHGVQYGSRYIITCFCQFLEILYRLLSLNYGLLTLVNGTPVILPISLITRQCRL
jgi:hypothetical protein